MRPIIALSICLTLIVPCRADDAASRARAAWAFASFCQPPQAQKSPGCTCDPCTCADGCKCGLPAAKSLKMPQPAEKLPVKLILDVPSYAQVWVQGQQMPVTGTRCECVSPPQDPGKEFEYTICVRDAFGAEETRTIDVRPGETYRESFRGAPTPTADARLPPLYLHDPMLDNGNYLIGGGRFARGGVSCSGGG